MEVDAGMFEASVVLRVDNLDQTRATLMRQGVEFERSIQEIPGEVRIATFRDPAGNRLHLCEVLSRNKAKADQAHELAPGDCVTPEKLERYESRVSGGSN